MQIFDCCGQYIHQDGLGLSWASPNPSANPDGGELQLMQGISASLEQQPNQFLASSSSSRTHGPLDDCNPPCTPPQLASDAQQACRAAPDPALPSAESAQPEVFTGSVVAQSSRSQEPTPDTASSLTGAGTGHQVGSRSASQPPLPPSPDNVPIQRGDFVGLLARADGSPQHCILH